MFGKLAKYTNFLGKVLILFGIVATLLLSFYWSFGFESIEVKFIFTEVGLISLSVDPEYFLALVMVFLFFIGYRLYSSRKPSQTTRLSIIENIKEVAMKYVLAIMLGIIGAWVTYFEFNKAFIWMYYLPAYSKISKASQAVKINGVIALLLLFIWFVTLKVYSVSKYKEEIDEL